VSRHTVRVDAKADIPTTFCQRTFQFGKFPEATCVNDYPSHVGLLSRIHLVAALFQE